MPGAFDGVRVVEFGEGVAAPFAGMLLAEQGADVVKVERLDGDRARSLPGFQVWNRSKRGAVIDTASASDREALAALVASADIFVWDRTQDQAKTEGADAGLLGSINPRLVYLAMPPFGERGPHATRPGDEALVAAYNGVLDQQPTYAGGPGYVVTPWSSISAGLLGAAAAAMGLFARSRTGWSGLVEVPGIAGGLAHQPEHVMEVGGSPAAADVAYHPLGPFPLFALQPCADGYLALGVSAPRQWHIVALGLDHPEWISDERFQDAPWGIWPPENREVLRGLLHDEFGRHTVQHWLDHLGPMDAPVASISTRGVYIDSPQVRHNGMRVEVDVPGLGCTVQLGVPVRLSETPGAVRCRAPLLGEHTAEVIAEARRIAGSHPAAPPPRVEGAPRPPLDGVRVLELNAYTAGPYAGGLLASFGAEVVRIESLDGDPTRQLAYTNFAFNGRKQSTALDLKAPGIVDAVRAGISSFDVLLENNRPGVLHRLGLGYEDLHTVAPRLVFASAYGWGADGPLANEPSFDVLVQARSGMLAAQGGSPETPCYTTNLVADYGGALQNVLMVAAALYARERTGTGQWAINALGNSTMVMQAGDFIFWPGKTDRPTGGRDVRGEHPGYRLYPCGDSDWLFLACSTGPHWQALSSLAAAPLPAWESVRDEPPDGATSAALAAWFTSLPAARCLAALDGAGVPAAPVRSANHLVRDGQLEANGLVEDYVHPAHGPMRVLRPLAHFHGLPSAPPTPDPGLGEHTRLHLRRWAVADDTIDRWVAAGSVIQGGPIAAPQR